MKQILQNLSNGETTLVDIPCPKCTSGSLLIASHNTVVSAGTERMLVDFGKASMLAKARQQPDKVKMVLNKIKTDGLLPTIDAVRSKLDQPLPLGYCNAGTVLESGAEGYSVGDRVVSNGNHAEVVRVSKNLCAKIPDKVDDESAAFTVLGAIGLQGIRLVDPTLGETVVVSGLGLIGLMTVQMLRANGCRVLGIDYNSVRCDMAKSFGADIVDLSQGEDPLVMAQAFSRGAGVDAVIVTAASKSDELMHQAAEMCRKRGRIVLVGVVGLNLRRDDFFKKEITFQVSASYGPGRYDPLYEDTGQDYPIGFVRWTEQRNFEAVLDMMASGTLNVKPLISHCFSIDEAVKAYSLLDDSSVLGIVLEYSRQQESVLRTDVVSLQEPREYSSSAGRAVIGFIGAGNYASRTLIPAFKKAGAVLEVLVTSGGISGVHHGKKAGFVSTTTELNNIWKNNAINTVAIVTRHDAHASQVIAALEAKKNIFVEKPLALTLEELDRIDAVFQKVNDGLDNPLRLMVGFNRRFAPHIEKMKSLLECKNEPKVIVITINAGEIPADHWTQDTKIGGGRIIGEGCHFIDLMRFLMGESITGHQSMMVANVPGVEVRDDKVSINLSFADGSFGTIHYLSNGGKAFPKERIEVFCENAVLQMDNYRILRGYGWPGFKKMKLFRQDKGQVACAHAFVNSIRQGKDSPISYREIMESSRVSIEVAESLRKQ
ncbi:putatve zinc-binding dehydrogenase [hydrothermal vent metagenome]|uniref:Putatve zinc-binding dehydrogenase n=1 Tax=hydrothermal vent metagenome TaxID=652676 RepID=A0A3B0YNX7_9ZZZZ